MPDPRSKRVDQPVPGFYLIRLVRGGVRVPARIFHDNGLWSASVMGNAPGRADADPLKADDVGRIHIWGQPISADEYWRRLGQEPPADPHRAVDLRSRPSLF